MIEGSRATMPNLLEQEAERLKRKYPNRYHRIIERNLVWISTEMALKRESVDISEGLVAMSTDLPSLSRARAGRLYKGSGTKRSGKHITARGTRKRQATKRRYKR